MFENLKFMVFLRMAREKSWIYALNRPSTFVCHPGSNRLLWFGEDGWAPGLPENWVVKPEPGEDWQIDKAFVSPRPVLFSFHKPISSLPFFLAFLPAPLPSPSIFLFFFSLTLSCFFRLKRGAEIRARDP